MRIYSKKKFAAGIFFIMTLLLLLTGCGKEEPQQMKVYSFSGQNQQFSISNGVIVLGGTEEIFYGGDLNVAGNLFNDVVSYSVTFYTMPDSEKNIILSNRVTDETGSILELSGDLGQVAGECAVSGSKADGGNQLKNNLYFELATKDTDGRESVYTLQMKVKELTGSDEKEQK